MMQNRGQIARINAIWTDFREWELHGMHAREERLLQYSNTLLPSMLENYSHRGWAIRLGRLAEAIPDTHGLLINAVWSQLPDIFKTQLSPLHDTWDSFVSALYQLAPGVPVVPAQRRLPLVSEKLYD
jgi:hypothetical protein